MGKYLILWEVDPTRIPTDPRERGMLWLGMMETVRKQINEGSTIDWGCFVGDSSGYAIGEQDDVELCNRLQTFVPFVKFTVRHVMSIDQMSEVAKALTE